MTVFKLLLSTTVLMSLVVFRKHGGWKVDCLKLGQMYLRVHSVKCWVTMMTASLRGRQNSVFPEECVPQKINLNKQNSRSPGSLIKTRM